MARRPADKRGRYQLLPPNHKYKLCLKFKQLAEGEIDEDDVKAYYKMHEGREMRERTFRWYKAGQYLKVLENGPKPLRRRQSKEQIELERCVADFVCKWSANNETTKSQITRVCRRFRDEKFRHVKSLEKLKFSTRFVDRFIERHGFGQATASSNAEPLPPEIIEAERQRLRSILSRYKIKNWVNCDETGLNWTFSKKRNPLVKKNNQHRRSEGIKKRITIGISCLNLLEKNLTVP